MKHLKKPPNDRWGLLIMDGSARVVKFKRTGKYWVYVPEIELPIAPRARTHLRVSNDGWNYSNYHCYMVYLTKDKSLACKMLTAVQHTRLFTHEAICLAMGLSADS